MRRLLAAGVLFCFLPTMAWAETAAPISRRDGFLLIWQSIRRPVTEQRETPYSDVLEGSLGEEEITYAKARGLLDDTETFQPDVPLTLGDALLWLFRTRNIADPDEIIPQTLTGFLLRYPVAHVPDAAQAAQTLGEEELLQVMRSLDQELRQEVHEVSLYAEKFHGKGTAFGESFDMNALTAAHRTFPYNTLVKVTNVDNSQSVTVRINDRGPYVEGRDMDLSLAAFTTIADRSKGVIHATFERLGDASLQQEEVVASSSGCIIKSPKQQHISKDTFLMRGVPHRLALGGVLTLSSLRPFVVRGVVYPDGTKMSLQDFVLSREAYTFRPSIVGKYQFLLSSISGRKRTMEMEVITCPKAALSSASTDN